MTSKTLRACTLILAGFVVALPTSFTRAAIYTLGSNSYVVARTNAPGEVETFQNKTITAGTTTAFAANAPHASATSTSELAETSAKFSGTIAIDGIKTTLNGVEANTAASAVEILGLVILSPTNYAFAFSSTAVGTGLSSSASLVSGKTSIFSTGSNATFVSSGTLLPGSYTFNLNVSASTVALS